MLQTTDVKQLLGGKIVKQTDKSSPFSFLLLDSQKKKVPLNGETAEVVLYTSKGKYWETSSKVTDGIVNFQMPGNLSVDNYKLEISVAGYVFPSKEDFIIKVVQGFKDLPNKETAENIKKTTEEFVREEAEKAVRELGKTELKGEKGDKGEKGERGPDGKSITITNTTKQGKDNIITFSDKTQITVKDGADGVDGKDAKVDAASIAKLSKSDKDIIRKEINAPNKDEVVLKEVGKGLSDNNFSNLYKTKLDNLDKDLEEMLGQKDDKTEVDRKVQEVKDLIFDEKAKYQADTIYFVDTQIEGDTVKQVPREVGKLVANDFLRVQVDSDKYKFRIKSTSQGIILFYSMTDEDLRYAIHVYPEIKDYEIDFGKTVTGEMIFTTVTMPEDKVSVIREEGL